MSKELNKAPVEQAEPASCQGTNCGTTTGDHSSECLAEAAASQGWELKPGDLCGRDCPMRPAPVEQAGGDERAAQWHECTCPKIGEKWNPAKHGNDCPVHQARAALAQPSPVRSSLLINGYQLRAALEFIAPDGTAKQLESEARIEWRQQDSDFLEAGLYAWCAEYPEEGCVLLDEEPTTSQPSPAPELAERGTQHRFSTTEQTCQHDFAGVWWNDNGETKTGRECRHCGFFVADVIKAQAEQAEAERPEVVGYRSATSRMVYEKDYGLQKPEPMMLVAFTACINERDAANARLHEVATACATAEQERDAALARVAELDKQCRDDVARALGLRPSQERGFAWSYLLASIKSCVKASEDAAQAQHSVPGDIMRDAQRYRWLRDQQFYFSFSTENSDAGISSCTAGMSSRFKNLSWVDAAIDSAIAAAPGKEVGHE
ncbi:hypothetical protein ACF0DE_13770 [Pseudomonas aeruginosa]|uniref:hypothetical protein n=1 Tax=Pseudomonas aeruginosa TaxID=287 RepID=UPI0019272DE6|nr:hypothetical protein [Pseudomonas aeruginosa]